MRSSKNRSRSKPNNRNNNNRSGANIVNRTFDSSGPEGKVRGTPQQIIEKYNQLARDAQLSNDRVAAENFQQHAEHYTRLLGAAQKEIDAQREQQEREQQERRDRQEAERLERAERAERNGERSSNSDRPSSNNDRQERTDRGDRPERSERPERRPRTSDQPRAVAAGEGDQPEIVAPAPDVPADTGLVETPEEAPKPKRARAPRKPRAPRAPKADAAKTETPKPAAPKADAATDEAPKLDFSAEAKTEAPATIPAGDTPEVAE
jgi:hypothetical protein